MRTLGVDLAAQPSNTSAAILDGTRLSELTSTADDDTILEMAAGCEAVGIDAPLGWPDPFVAVIEAHHRGQPLPESDPRSLQLRRTDLDVHGRTGKRPLSVSTDRIGVVALRAIRLLERLAGPGADRAGSAGIYETYPGGAVAHWKLVDRSYKRADSTRERAMIVDALEAHLDVGPHRSRMIASDDDLDAVLCAAIASLASLRLTGRPEGDDVVVAAREGWIHVPCGPMTDLAQLHD